MKRVPNPTGKGGFKKGQVANPGGRPKKKDEVVDLARSYTTEAIERLAHWMRSDDASASVRATESILSRAWGKPDQPISGDMALKVEIVKLSQ